MKRPSLIQVLTGTAVAASVLVPFAVFAKGIPHGRPGMGAGVHRPPAQHGAGRAVGRPDFSKNILRGTVSVVNGTALTVTNASGTAYTVDAGTAKFMGVPFGGNAQSISNIQVGDKVMVNGTITGTSVVAKLISDMSLMARTNFSGTVTAVSGTTISMTGGREKTAYTVTAAAATLNKGFRKGTPITVADIQVGDRLTVVGTMSGTSITASSVNDMGKPVAFKGGHSFPFRGGLKK